MKRTLLFCLIAFATMLSGNIYAQKSEKYMVSVKRIPPKHNPKPPAVDGREPKIQVAILLDTSSSMDGLINQAKARLWNIVNTMGTLKYNGQTPRIEIALYEYGHNSIPEREDYIRQVTPLTTDLDLISERLFALTTYGGAEYCGGVIDRAVKQLRWGTDRADMKLIYIAGNEEFTQGSKSYRTAIANALENNIYVNTIHCGNRSEGINGMWEDGAKRGKGKFFNIDHNAQIRHYDTPYDDRISECNRRLNDTYVSYGARGNASLKMQAAQDMNASAMSKSVAAERAVSKSSKAYTNSNWDLVDKVKEDKESLRQMDKKDLPAAYQDKSTEEIQKDIENKQKERDAIQAEIKTLAEKRQKYIDEQAKKIGEAGDDLGVAINESVIEFANAKGYVESK